MVIPVDFADKENVALVVKYLYTYVKRRIPVRFGIVPVFHSEDSVAQAKVVHFLRQEYGLSVMLEYLENVRTSTNYSGNTKLIG